MPEVVLTGAAGRIEGRYTQGKSETAPDPNADGPLPVHRAQNQHARPEPVGGQLTRLQAGG